MSLALRASRFHRHFLGSAEEFHLTIAALAAWLRARSVAERYVAEVSLIADELISNVIRHGYRAPGPIHVTITVRPELLTLTVQDWAPPFDPAHAERADTGIALTERSEGGLGVFIVRAMASHIQYRRSFGSNLVRVIKSMPSKENITMLIHNIIADLGMRIGLPKLQLDLNGLCELMFDGHLRVMLILNTEAESLMLSAMVGQVPAAAEHQRIKELLSGNFLWRETAGATLSLDRSNTVWLMQSLNLHTLDGAMLIKKIEQFVNTQESWKRRLDGVESPAGRSPLQFFSNRP